MPNQPKEKTMMIAVPIDTWRLLKQISAETDKKLGDIIKDLAEEHLR